MLNGYSEEGTINHMRERNREGKLVAYTYDEDTERISNLRGAMLKLRGSEQERRSGSSI